MKRFLLVLACICFLVMGIVAFSGCDNEQEKPNIMNGMSITSTF